MLSGKGREFKEQGSSKKVVRFFRIQGIKFSKRLHTRCYRKGPVQGVATRTLNVPSPQGSWEKWKTPEPIVREIAWLIDDHTYGEIARMFEVISDALIKRVF